MKNLYRRYRPLKLSDVVGQDQVTKPLENALKSNKVGHAYLFIGPRGTGKTSVARIFAHAVNGFDYTLEDDYVDIIEIDGASNRGIDNIRELREKVAIAPTVGKYKVYIIDEVHMLTKEAFNALLKTLEEPPEHAIFIMATTDAYKVPVTITSRAQVYNFALAEPKVMLEHLRSICEKEGIKIDEDALGIIVKRGGGSYRDSLSLLEQISTLSDSEITKGDVERAMGLAADDKIHEVLEAYTTGNLGMIADKLKEIYRTGIEAKTLAEELINAIIEAPQPEYMKLLAKLTEVKTPFAEARLLAAMAPEVGTTSSPTQRVFARTAAPVKPAIATVPQPPSVDATEEAKPEAPATTAQAGDFDWNAFTEAVTSMNDAVGRQLFAAEYEFDGATLTIYPSKPIFVNILNKDNNKKILIQAAGGVKVTVKPLSERQNVKNDPLISKMSDIMGGEVKNDTGGNPF